MSKARVIPGQAGHPPTVVFHCTGCKQNHAVPFTSIRPHTAGLWFFDGNLDKPTIEPSLRVLGGLDGKGTACHVIVTNGLLHYCGDDPHLPNQVSGMLDCELITD